MARPKSYDRNQALERACYAFWEHGYSTLGVRELERLTGLNKFAIRSEFGGKEGLYLEALEYYSEAAKATVLSPMRSGGIETIEAFFHGLVKESSVNSSPWGCLVVNTGIENAELNRSSLQAASEDYWSTVSGHFEIALSRSIEAGELDGAIDIDEACRGLVTAVMGVHTMNRISGAHDAGTSLVNLVSDLIKTWRV